MRVVIALDSFKGSLTSIAASQAAAKGVRRVFPDADIDIFPVADGGEGTVAALAGSAEILQMESVDTIGNALTCSVALLGNQAVIESAQAAGLSSLPERTPHYARRASSYGLGQLLKTVSQIESIDEVLVGLGGTGCTDGGVGLVMGLGGKVWTEDGELIPAKANPLLSRPAWVELPQIGVQITGLMDVTAPLVGPGGAARIFGPQKGADQQLVAELDEAMESWAGALKDVGHDVAQVPGAGSAGGIGAALLALGGHLEPGLPRVLKETGANRLLAQADIVITGEGAIDEQTRLGKTPEAIAKLAKENGPCIVVALAGSVSPGVRGSFDVALPIIPRPMSLAEAMRPEIAVQSLEESTCAAMRLLSLPRPSR